MKNQLTRKIGFEGTPKLDPCWKSRPVTSKVNFGVEIRIESTNKDNSHSWVRLSHGLNKLVTDLSKNKENDNNEQETSRCSSKILRWKRMYLLLRADQRRKQTKKTCHYLLIYKNCTYSWKNMDWYWTRSWIRSSVPSGKKTKHSSSARRITSRRRWSDRILETERWSSEQIWALSILVWWYVEEQDGRRRRQQEKISILCWSVRTRNSLPPSSSKSFTTQYHWSFITGQCTNSEQFLRVHLSNLHSIINSGLIAGGQNSSRKRQTVFFTAVNPMNMDHRDPQVRDLTKLRFASYKKKW